ncbi:unnamed protein product [Cyclocybe aegerita]|uniref:Uncharacterized protein n=1 Tax=Cyclocybe aegerita TaxID=1973307 RepID=A0A8S0WVI5_CYCAE|nr:unnamed protein product [Cyclocybe aegerita]
MAVPPGPKHVQITPSTSQYAPGSMEAIGNLDVMQRLDAIENQLRDLKKDQQINNAVVLNHGIIARNRQNYPSYERLEKHHDIDRVLALTPRLTDREDVLPDLIGNASAGGNYASV